MSAAQDTKPRLFAFPKSGIAYNNCLHKAAAAQGLDIHEGVWSGRWLTTHVRCGDFLHIHWPSFLYFDQRSRTRTWIGLARFMLLLHLVRARGARIIWTAHNLYPHDGGRAMLVHRIARRFMAHYAYRIMAHGPTAAHILAKEFSIPAEKLTVIKHGNWIGYHEHSLNSAQARQQLGIGPEQFVYAFVGSCKPYKNAELLIEQFTKLNDNSVLIIAGQFQSDAYRRRIEAMLQQLPIHRWRLYPRFLDDNEVQRYVLAGNVLVVPYAEILTSGSAMLGLSFGRPVIAPNVGGLRDMISSQCGLLYEPGSPEHLFNALRGIQPMQFSESAIIDIARTFDWLEAATTLVRIVSE